VRVAASPFRRDVKATLVMPQQFYSVGAPITESEQMAAASVLVDRW
jgi:hypothetical protein